MTFKQLNAGDQNLLKLMQTVDYGRLELSCAGINGSVFQ